MTIIFNTDYFTLNMADPHQGNVGGSPQGNPQGLPEGSPQGDPQGSPQGGPQGSPSPIDYVRGNTPPLVSDDLEAAHSALEKINQKSTDPTENILKSNIASKIPGNHYNLNRREVRVVAASLNNYIGDHEYAYIKGTRAEGNILTPTGKAANDGELLVKNPIKGNYQSLRFKDKSLVNGVKDSLKSMLSGSRAPSPNSIDSVG